MDTMDMMDMMGMMGMMDMMGMMGMMNMMDMMNMMNMQTNFAEDVMQGDGAEGHLFVVDRALVYFSSPHPILHDRHQAASRNRTYPSTTNKPDSPAGI